MDKYLANLELYSIIASMLKKRYLEKTLTELLGMNPAVVLIGPRQVGKTTLAHMVASNKKIHYLDLESTEDKAKLANPVKYLSEHDDKLVILDEIQRIPKLFQDIRGIIDEGRRKGNANGRFLFLGSASIDLLRQSSETLAGRIAILELTPFNVLEIKDINEDDLWIRGGFPESFLANSIKESVMWRKNFIKTYLERDIPQLGPRIPAETLRRFWVMLAHSNGGLLNTANLARSLGVDGKTVASYLDLMVDLLLVRRLQPWHGNVKKRLVKSPKVYVRDTGIVHSLLGLETKDDVLGHPIVGESWEGFVIENILSVLPDDVESYFYRTATGVEADLVLISPRIKKPLIIEIKRSTAPKAEDGLKIAMKDINTEQAFIVYPNKESYQIGNNVQVISLRKIMKMVSTI